MSFKDGTNYTCTTGVNADGSLSLAKMKELLAASIFDVTGTTGNWDQRQSQINDYTNYNYRAWHSAMLGPDYSSMKFADLPEKEKPKRCQKLKDTNAEISFVEYEEMYHYWNMPNEQEIDTSFYGQYGMGLETATAREVQMQRDHYADALRYAAYSPRMTSALGISPLEKKTTSAIDWTKLVASS